MMRIGSKMAPGAVRAGAALLLAPLLLLSAAARCATAQSTLERGPNLAGTWIGERGVAHFNFLHRFNHTGPPERQIINQPTFLLAYSTGFALVGVNYATRSDVEAGLPNEWEPLLRVARRVGGGAAAAALTASYNAAVRRPAAELALQSRAGRLQATGALRVLGGRDGGGVRAAAGGGLVARLHENAALAADVIAPFEREAGEEIAFGVGVQLRIPYTPHTLSLQATNTNSATLHGSSRGRSRLSYGFEFTVPITLRRYFGRRAAAAGAARAAADAALTAGDTLVVEARIANLAYAPDSIVVSAGTTIVWRNDDPLEHTVTADDESWDSGDIAPGATWRRRFDVPGRYPFHCAPHPFMTGVVIVR
jgi:plastocyanin